MSYTVAFNNLYRKFHDTCGVALSPKTQYYCVAIYVGRVMMAATIEEETENHLDSPITRKIEWAETLLGEKQNMINTLMKVTRREWNLIKTGMIHYANRSRGSEVWLNRRLGFVAELDTLWEFHN